jgi:nicotinate phosphoribosyltransferase
MLSDLHTLNMLHAWRQQGMAERRSVYNLVLRSHPFGGGVSVAAGLASVIEQLAELRVTADEADYLLTLRDATGKPRFDAAFVDWLQDQRFACDIDAVPEGTVVFEQEPLLRVIGPLAQCQLIDSLLLGSIGFQTWIATRAARMCKAALKNDIVEFGLRRSHGTEAGLWASRAAFIGGCAATSNLAAGRRWGIPVRGDQRHSWVMSFDSEPAAFRAWAEAVPSDCEVVVDTFDTFAGVRRVIEVGHELQRRGGRLAAVRLDSGDLRKISQPVRQMLDDAGLKDAVIIAGGAIDEHQILELKKRNAPISVWCVGAQLTSGAGEGALDVVYNPGAVEDASGDWRHRFKATEDSDKATMPGMLQVRRFGSDTASGGDVVYCELTGFTDPPEVIDQHNHRRTQIPAAAPHRDLLVPIIRGGSCVYDLPPVAESQELAAAELARLPDPVRSLKKPGLYPVGLEAQLHQRRTDMTIQAKQHGGVS